MDNVEISVKANYAGGVTHRMFFGFENENEISITTVDSSDHSQHDLILTAEDYLFLRNQFDNHFGFKKEDSNGKTSD